MKSFVFKLKALLRLKENKRDVALSQFAGSVQVVEKLNTKLTEARDRQEVVFQLMQERQKGIFRGQQIQSLQSSLDLERECISKIELELKQAQEIKVSRREIFLSKDSEYKAVLKLQEKQKEAHYFQENSKEQKELEDIIGARFLFQRINRQAYFMKFSASVIVLLAVLMSVASAGLMLFLHFDDLFKPAPVVKAEFTSVEFDADDTSYSPAETHSMNQLSKELSLLKDKLLEREKDLDARESALSMDVESLEKQKRELNRIQDDLSSRLAEFESKKGKDLSEEKLKEYKDTANRWIEMGPEVASVEIQNWRQKRRFEEALGIFEMLKAEDKAPIIAFMLNSDQDDLIELADALAMRDRGLLPSVSME